MRSGHGADHRDAEAGASGTGGEEVLADLPQDLLAHAGTVVPHLDPQPLPGGEEAQSDPGARTTGLHGVVDELSLIHI